MEVKLDDIISLAKRRGFFFPTAEIYNSLAGFYDFGPNGFFLKKRIEQSFYIDFLSKFDSVYIIDSNTVLPESVLRASGHTQNFTDPLITCPKCKEKFKEDDLQDKESSQDPSHKDFYSCPNCKTKIPKKDAKQFNLMFETYIGAEKANKAYLRPETAQNIFLNFQNIVHAFSPKLPFGIAQFGKAFRNEISPRNFLFRLREFSQFELEYFYDASQKQNLKLSNPNKQIKILTKEMQAKKQNETKQKISELLKSTTPLHASVLENSVIWLETLGINLENVRLRQNLDSERAHYSKDTWEIEYIFPFGWKEIVGVADRGNYDLSNHSKFSGKDLSILNEETGKKIVPSVIEPSFGLERLILAIMFDAYRKETKKVKRETGTVTEERVFLSLNKKLFPKAGIFPLVRKDGLDKKAQQIYKMLKSKLPQISFFISEKQSIGKRYAREDEIGTPFCITVDYETMKGKTKDTVTIRWRDTTRQKRIKIKDLEKFFRKELL